MQTESRSRREWSYQTSQMYFEDTLQPNTHNWDQEVHRRQWEPNDIGEAGSGTP